MKQYKLLFIFLILIPLSVFTQNNRLQMYSGISIGGPLPDKTAEDSHVQLKPGLTTGLSYNLYSNKSFSIAAEISFQYINLNYGQKIKKDTIIQIQIPLQNGNILTSNINTYYKADVNGAMKLNYFKGGSNFSYIFKKYTLTLGTYLIYFSGGYDKGDVYVTIGEGGVTGLDDYYEKYHNNSGINQFTFELLLRAQRKIYKKISLGMQVSRGITPFYNKNFDIRGQQMKFYNTIVGMNVNYEF